MRQILSFMVAILAFKAERGNWETRERNVADSKTFSGSAPYSRTKRCVSIRRTPEGDRVYLGLWSWRGVVNARPVEGDRRTPEELARAVASQEGLDHYYDHREGNPHQVFFT